MCETYFSFPLGDKPANFTKAEIRIYYFGVLDASVVTITASLITEAWGETAITWNTRPAHGQVIDIISCVKTGLTQSSWIILDVTNLIQSKSEVEYCLEM